MKIRSRRLLRRVPQFLIPFLSVFFIGGFSIANAPVDTFRLKPPSQVNHRNKDISEIVSALEAKVGVSHDTTQKLKDKTLRLSGKRLRLIASLAELIADGDEGPGADMVLLVMTILVLVS